MNKTDMLTKELFKKSNIFIRGNANNKDPLYDEDLIYGIKRVLNLDVIPDREKDKRIDLRLTPYVEVTDRERHEVYSTFAYEFYESYLLNKKNYNYKTPNKTIKELKQVFKEKKTEHEKINTCILKLR